MSEPERRTRLYSGYRYKNRALIIVLQIVDYLLSMLPRRSSPLPSAPRSILIMKPDHLGDLLMLTSVLPLLALRYPQAAIDLLCGSWGWAVLGNNPALRRVIPLEHICYDRRSISPFRKLLDFCRSLGHTVSCLRAERYDLCLNFRDAGGDLILLARSCGCRHIVGHGTGGFGALLDTSVSWTEGLHEIEHYIEVLRPLGVKAELSGLHYEIFPQPADEVMLTQLLAESVREPFVVIHPGCGDLRKLRPAEAWARLIDGLDQSLNVIVTGTKDEQQLFSGIAAAASRKLLSLMGALTVPQLFLLLKRAERVYALDSLAAHLGAAAGTPITVFWSVTNDPAQWRPLGVEVTLLDSLSEQPLGPF